MRLLMQVYENVGAYFLILKWEINKIVYLILFRRQGSKVFRECPTKQITLTKKQSTVAVSNNFHHGVFPMHNIKVNIYNNAYYE